MFGKILKGTIGIVGDVANVALLPVAMTVDVVRAGTAPISEAMKDVASDIHDALKPEPDCNRCSDTGQIHYTTPSGRRASERCPCGQ